MKRLLLLFTIAAGWPSLAGGQPAPTAEQMVEVDPIRCWWRTTAGAVRIGEPFGLTLTCAVLDNEAVQVVPDESRLAGAVISMAPFEIVASSHPQDLRGGQRRFFQYDYTMRIINPDAIGTDVPIPIMSLHYRVSSRIAANASVQGRDLTYVLPPQSIRILSLVTADAPDIRDSSGERFSTVEALTLRAGVLDVAAVTLAALGSLMVVVVLVRLIAGARKGAGAGEHLMGAYTVLRHAGRELAEVGRVADQGWTNLLAARALAATRIAAGVAIGRPVSQRPAGRSAEAGAGRIIAGKLFGRGTSTALWSSVTSEAVARAIARTPATDPDRRQLLESLQSALVSFDRAQYCAGDTIDRTSLDAAVASATAATSRLKSEHMWPKPSIRRWTMRAPEPEHQT